MQTQQRCVEHFCFVLNGRQFEVDRVVDVRNAAAHKFGGVGIRYTCKICGKTVELFDEDGHWFMEQ